MEECWQYSLARIFRVGTVGWQRWGGWVLCNREWCLLFLQMFMSFSNPVIRRLSCPSFDRDDAGRFIAQMSFTNRVMWCLCRTVWDVKWCFSLSSPSRSDQYSNKWKGMVLVIFILLPVSGSNKHEDWTKLQILIKIYINVHVKLIVKCTSTLKSVDVSQIHQMAYEGARQCLKTSKETFE